MHDANPEHDIMFCHKIIEAYSTLGRELSGIVNDRPVNDPQIQGPAAQLASAIDQACLYNPWFVPSFVNFAVKSWSETLKREKIERWLENYPQLNAVAKRPLTVAIVMAGNIPMVGLHDLLCTLASGHRALIRLSSADARLIPAMLELLYSIDPEIKKRVRISDGPLKDFDAIIATGSNNTSRYFEYYFGRYPNIIRKNRNSAAILDGQESEKALAGLADDIMMYFGLGCRNVSKLYIPEGYNVEKLYPHLESYAFARDHNKYRNNFDYQKSVLIINNIPHLDNGFMIFREDIPLISPVSVIHYEYYDSAEKLNLKLADAREQLQCVVSENLQTVYAIPPGKSQAPELWDYADGIDTMNFLLTLAG